MRLAILHQREGGGATVHARDLLDLAARSGHATAYHPDGRDDAGEDGLLRRLEAFAPDVVHAHCFYNTWSPGLLTRVAARWPVAFTLHDVYPVNQYGTECWECYRNPSCWACPAVPLHKRVYSVYRIRSRRERERAWRGLDAHVVYPTAWMRRRVARTALARLPGSVIPYGIDTEAFAPEPAARERLGVPGGAPLIVSVGSMYSPKDDRKGFAFLFEAFARVVRAQIPAARLVVIGRLFEAAPPEGVEILSGVDRGEIRLWYSAADAFAQPSLGDNAPLSVLEAMASGAAVVGTSVGGIPEEIAAGETGLLVPPRDADALGAALVRILRDPALRTAFGLAGRRRAVERFGRERAWAGHEALYRSLAARR